ncbi:type II toxin-antitoxin system VapC family toxin [Candidatus Sumerlaeota bacterium]|nr:type II toxin-antitoxin system VapC family toxin [Candidatus Sumerlaeota bacterium]
MYLLDTNHCSNLIDGHPRIIQKLKVAGNTPISISVITRGELAFMVRHSERRAENAVKVAAFLSGIRIRPVENEIADLYGELKETIISRFGPRIRRERTKVSLERLGFRENDLWIGATALRYGLTIASADWDFIRMKEAIREMKVENWLS